MKLSVIIPLFLFLFLITSCSKDDPTITPVDQETPNDDPIIEEEEITQEAPYFTFNIDSGYYFDSIFKEGYIIIHNDQGELLDFQKFANGGQLIFEAEEGQTVSDQLTITQFIHLELQQGEDYYTIFTFPLIAKSSEWNLTKGISTYNPSGEFDVTLTDVEGWKNYKLSNKDGHGPGGSSYYKWFNNPEDAEPTIEIDGTDWFSNNDFLLTIIDANSNVKYVDIANVQQGDSIVLSSSDLLDFDDYLEIDLPTHDGFSHGVYGFESAQNYESGGLALNVSYDYVFTEPVDQLKLGYLNRFSKFKTAVSVTEENYIYKLEQYGAKPNAITLANKGTFTISDSTQTNFSYATDLTFEREKSVWSTRRDFFDSDFSSTSWLVYAPHTDTIDIYALPEAITDLYSNLDIDQIKHESTTLYLQSNSYQSFINRRFGTEKIDDGYVEESMLFGEGI